MIRTLLILNLICHPDCDSNVGHHIHTDWVEKVDEEI